VPDGTPAVHEKMGRYIFETKLPAHSERDLKKLALEVTANRKSDKEKVLAIVTHLRDSKRYSYTLRLDQLRPVEDEDAIERFLLDSDPKQHRGHCAYFATGFVLLCRLNNIPARLVRGFSVDF